MTVNVTRDAINVREKLAELDKPTGIAGEAMLRAETPQEQFNLIGAGRRNLIINGGMQVAQRGTSVSGTFGTYGLDRWRMYSNASCTMSQQSFTLGQTDVEGYPKHYLKIVPTTNSYSVGQRIEDLTTVGDKTLTLSFWIKGSEAATFDCSYTRYFGSGGSSSDTTEFLSDQAITTSWSKVTKTFTVGSLSGKTVGSGSYLQITFGDSISFTSSQTVEIANVQLELGKVATPFEHRSYGEELALCQRYYQRLTAASNNAAICTTSLWTGGTSGYGVLHLPTELRTAPTVSVSGTFVVFSGGGTTNVTSVGGGSNFNGNSVELVFNHSAIGSAGDSAWIRMGATGNYVALDAEL